MAQEIIELDEIILKNIEAMNQLAGFGVVIVCCSSVKQVLKLLVFFFLI
jgi:hypothetical protein